MKGSVRVIDGGFMVHKIVWHRQEIFSQILDKHVEYVQKNYSSNTSVVFDGYPEDSSAKSTKTAERCRRSKSLLHPEIIFEENMPATVTQSKFLANKENKALLRERFESAGSKTKQAKEDAGVLIVNTAIEYSENSPSVIIVSEDSDLLVILTASSNSKKNIYFLKPGKGKVPNKTYSLNQNLTLADNVSFTRIHRL